MGESQPGSPLATTPLPTRLPWSCRGPRFLPLAPSPWASHIPQATASAAPSRRASTRPVSRDPSPPSRSRSRDPSPPSRGASPQPFSRPVSRHVVPSQPGSRPSSRHPVPGQDQPGSRPTTGARCRAGTWVGPPCRVGPGGSAGLAVGGWRCPDPRGSHEVRLSQVVPAVGQALVRSGQALAPPWGGQGGRGVPHRTAYG